MAKGFSGLIQALGHHPAGWIALSAIAGLAGQRYRGCVRPLPWLLSGLSIVVLIYTLAYCVAYLLYPTFTDHVEATIASNSAYLMQGRPLYHSPASEEWYSIIYGPWLFLAVEGAFRAFGSTVLSSKMPGIGCLVLALSGFILVGYRRWGLLQACLAASLLSAGIVIFAPLIASNRGDSVLILATVTGLSLLRASRKHVALLVMGTLAGVATGIKLHAFAYLLPAVAVIAAGLGRHCWQGWLIFASTAAAVFGLPFLSPAISWSHLSEHIHLSARHGLDWSSLALGLELIGLFVVAAAVAQRARAPYRVLPEDVPREIVWLLWINVVTAVLVLYPASKEGGGMHHIAPLFPYFIFGVFETGRYLTMPEPSGKTHDRLLIGVSGWFAALCLIFGAAYWHRNLDGLSRLWSIATEAHAEVMQLAQKLPQDLKLIMAFGDSNSYWLTWYRPILVLQSNPIGIDPVAAMDLRKAGYDLPLAYFRCGAGEANATAWIFPKRGVPFSMKNYYLPHDRIADPGFLTEFSKAAKPTMITKHYTLWQCRTPQSDVLH